MNLTLDRNDGVVKLGLCQQIWLQQEWLTGVNMQGHTFAAHKDTSAGQQGETPTNLCVQQLGYFWINVETKKKKEWYCHELYFLFTCPNISLFSDSLDILNSETSDTNTTVKSFSNLPAQQQLQGSSLLHFTVADVALSTCSGNSNSPKLLITSQKVTEVQSDLPDIADLAKRCRNRISKAKEIHAEALVIHSVILTNGNLLIGSGFQM